ncbi:MAG: VIT domain-containing protein, partial [Planctomycetota bacterium]
MNIGRFGMVAAVLLMAVACKEPSAARPEAPPAEELGGNPYFTSRLRAGEYDELLILERETPISYSKRLQAANTIGFERIRQVDPNTYPPLSLSPWFCERIPLAAFLFDDAADGDTLAGVAQEYDLQLAARVQAPGCGGMLTRVEQRTVVVPLAHTEVSGRVFGDLASIEVRQEFENPFDVPIEAVYVFPLPQSAAVSDFLMTIGDRTIRGVVREREEATRIYEAARAQGITASLLTQERANIFTQKVANIAPGAGIDVSIEYFHVLPYRDGWYELVFPMVVGPRYNPPASTDGIGAVSLASRDSSGQTVEVPYLRAHERNGHDIGLTLEIDAGVPLEGLECTSHAVEVERPSAERARVKLAALDSLPNRDFVLRYKAAGSAVRTSLSTYVRDGEGWFRMTVLPPAALTSLPSRPLEMIFVVDCSGSMDGRPLEQAKLAILEALKRLRPEDSFEVIRFSNQAAGLSRNPLPASSANVQHGIRFVNSLTANGGTQMIQGIRAALRHPGDPERLRVVTFLTDGY